MKDGKPCCSTPHVPSTAANIATLSKQQSILPACCRACMRTSLLSSWSPHSLPYRIQSPVLPSMEAGECSLLLHCYVRAGKQQPVVVDSRFRWGKGTWGLWQLPKAHAQRADIEPHAHVSPSTPWCGLFDLIRQLICCAPPLRGRGCQHRCINLLDRQPYITLCATVLAPSYPRGAWRSRGVCFAAGAPEALARLELFAVMIGWRALRTAHPELK
jgi:hypothetical protein